VRSNECQTAFDRLKEALAIPPVLAMPNDGGHYVLDTDASDFAIGAVLSQEQRGELKVIAYASRRLSPRERNYCVTRREVLAVIYYLKYFRHYLLGTGPPVRVRTDHAAIVWLRRIPEPVGQQARWLELMEEYQLEIEHRPGLRHGNADAMSRDRCLNTRCCPQVDGPSPAESTRTDGNLVRTLGTRILVEVPAAAFEPACDDNSRVSSHTPACLRVLPFTVTCESEAGGGQPG
jgi:hypothetical protein